MKFAIFTDPHLNAFPEKKTEFLSFLKELDPQVDGFICSGDWCSTDVDELEEIFAICRQGTSKPILTVPGNHDIWNIKRKYSLDEIFQLHQDLAKKYDITLLEYDVFATDKSSIIGFMGWYNIHSQLNTVDYDYIPVQNSLGCSAYHFLKKREMDGIYRVIDHKTDKEKVCITHFGFSDKESSKAYTANDRHAEILSEHCSIVVYGHSHKKEDYMKGNCHFYNAGADYNQSINLHYFILDL